MHLKEACLLSKGWGEFMIPISIVILSYNRLDEIRRNLISLLVSSRNGDEIIVVDNNSDDGSKEFLNSLCGSYPDLKIIFNKKNLGVAAGRNVGFRSATNEIVVCLDDDAYLSPDQFSHVAKYFNDNSKLGALSISVVHGEKHESQNPHGDSVIEVANYHGAAHAFRKKALESIYYLDEDCFYGGEELDSCVRLHAAGYMCVYTPEIVAKHFSSMRNTKIELDRFLLWTYSFARIHFKNFPKEMAKTFSYRLLVGRLYYGVKYFGLSAALKIYKAHREGCKVGSRQHHSVGEKTILFYENSLLRPAYGNIPLKIKVMEVLQNKLCNQRIDSR